MSLALTSRKAALLAPWNRNPLWSAARAVPSLDLRFADSKSLVAAITGQSLVTFTRASSGTYVDSAGALQTATTNEARFTHDPTTGESLGLLVEEQRTNSIRNNTMVGAVAGTPGTLPTNWNLTAAGLTSEILGTGVTNGITYIDLRLSGTPSASTATLSFESNAGVSAAQNQSWTVSAWLAVVGGSFTNISALRLNLDERTTTSYLATNTGENVASTTTSSLVRRSYSSTLGNASTQVVVPYVRLFYTTGLAIDITLRIGMPQLEQGAFATSVIPTTTTAVTRSADVCSITGSAFSSFYRQDQGTFYVQGLVPPRPAGFPTLYQASDGTVDNVLVHYIHTSGYYGNVRSGNIVQGDPGVIVSPVAGLAYRTAFAARQDNAVISVNGAIGISDTSLLMPLNQSEMRIGANRTGGGAINTTIRRLCYWPTRLDDEVLQRITL